MEVEKAHRGSNDVVSRQGGAEPAREHEESPRFSNAAAERALASMGQSFGRSFEDVKVKTGSEGAERARAHGAEAVTEGKSIFFAEGAFAPDTTKGQKVLAHELAHVVQQENASGGSGRKGGQRDALEREAHGVAETVAAGGRASPGLRSPEVLAQGYDSFEHKDYGDSVEKTLTPLAQGSQVPTMGGQPVPDLKKKLSEDPFLTLRSPTLTLPLRNYEVTHDEAGPYLAIETDAQGQAVRYDVPVSPGDVTALNGDLYSSMDTLRKAPVSELEQLKGILKQEVDYEANAAAALAAGRPAPPPPNFGRKWEEATAWRSQPVYFNGQEVGIAGQAAGGDTSSYLGLAARNQAHFGEDTQGAAQLAIQVKVAGNDDLARGPQGNDADGNEQAWLDGHARALLYAKESFALRGSPAVGPPTQAQAQAVADTYPRSTSLPATGLAKQGAANQVVAHDLGAPVDAVTGKPLAKTSGAVTAETKLNDAWVENAGADHFLTDAFAAGHQIVRSVIGEVTETFVKNKGGVDKFLDLIVTKVQEAAKKDPTKAPGDLGTFQDKSKSWWWSKAARGDSWLNSFADGLKQKLAAQLDDVKLRALGAKMVHDYYNTHGIAVHNRKNMSFKIMGDDTAAAGLASKPIIELAVLESRNQVTEAATKGTDPDPLAVWDYTPDLDKTKFTEANGSRVLEIMTQDGDYLWNMLKENFWVTELDSVNASRNATNQGASQGAGPTAMAKGMSRGQQQDVGAPPQFAAWLSRRQKFVSQLAHDQGQGHYPPAPEIGTNRRTADGVEIPDSDG